MLEQVRIARPRERYHAYPFELSGGMCQRVVIALALACRPQLLIADEPTTGLDVTTQKAVMDLVVELTRERGMSTILITHDLGLAAAYCDRVVVMEKGTIVENARVRRHLQEAVARLYAQADAGDAAAGSFAARSFAGRRKPRAAEGKARSRRDKTARKARRDVCWSSRNWSRNIRARAADVAGQDFPPKPPAEPDMFRAVDGISFSIARGESVGLVGESGCGKSTTSMMVMRLIDKTSGTIMFNGEDIGEIPARNFATLPQRKRIQMVFQDPTDSLNPRFTAARAIADPLLQLGGIAHGEVRARCEELATQVGLPLELLDRFPHQLSGGQKARVGIARAIALKPDLIILDEPTAALDVSVQAVVLNLLQDLKDSLGMSYLFVSHDLNVVRLLCDRVIVMQTGQIVEQGPTERVMVAPEASYTRDLLAAIPHPPV